MSSASFPKKLQNLNDILLESVLRKLTQFAYTGKLFKLASYNLDNCVKLSWLVNTSGSKDKSCKVVHNSVEA